MATNILSQGVHQKRVAILCRFCRDKVQTSQGYCTIIKYIHDISNDKPEIHPAIICGQCRRKLGHSQNIKKIAKIIAFPEFKPHSDSNCFCLTKEKLDHYKFFISVID